jgi:heme/copper-type cytochrome/quinol oxidase subunit 4
MKTKRHVGIIIVAALAVLIGAFSFWYFLYREANKEKSYSGARFVTACPILYRGELI